MMSYLRGNQEEDTQINKRKMRELGSMEKKIAYGILVRSDRSR
jgi:hypothetical protein